MNATLEPSRETNTDSIDGGAALRHALRIEEHALDSVQAFSLDELRLGLRRRQSQVEQPIAADEEPETPG